MAGKSSLASLYGAGYNRQDNQLQMPLFQDLAVLGKGFGQALVVKCLRDRGAAPVDVSDLNCYLFQLFFIFKL